MERIKAVRGNSLRTQAVIDWLQEHGGMTNHEDNYSDENLVFFVVNGSVFSAFLGDVASKLVEIVPLPRWRAKYGGTYFYVSAEMRPTATNDCNDFQDLQRFTSGNYFQTYEEAKEYTVKITDMLRNR